jgi:hypothetical protein
VALCSAADASWQQLTLVVTGNGQLSSVSCQGSELLTMAMSQVSGLRHWDSWFVGLGSSLNSSNGKGLWSLVFGSS